jgi:hypothetical protein
MQMLIFWVLTLCGIVGKYQRFGGTYYLHLQGFLAMFLGVHTSQQIYIFFTVAGC